MNFVLDTNIILHYLKDTNKKKWISENVGPLQNRNVPIISVVSVAEIKALAAKNNWGNKRTLAIEEFLKELIIIDIKYNELIDAYVRIDTFSQVKSKEMLLNTSSRNMGKNDLWIAATALLTNSKLITTDSDFRHLDDTFFEVILIK